MSTGLVYLIAAIAFGSAMVVRWWLKRTYARWGQVPNQHGATGAQIAQAILDHNDVHNVKIESVKGKLTDHFDPARDILRLSRQNFSGTSVAAMAVSAHEAGHAIQDATDDFRLKIRKFLVPVAALGSRFAPMVLIGAMVFGSGTFLRLGMFLLAGTMVFQLFTLPVEFNASRRAMRNLEALGLDDPDQQRGTRLVLTAAALTYVAAAATSIAYFATLFASRGRGGRTTI